MVLPMRICPTQERLLVQTTLQWVDCCFQRWGNTAASHGRDTQDAYDMSRQIWNDDFLFGAEWGMTKNKIVIFFRYVIYVCIVLRRVFQTFLVLLLGLFIVLDLQGTKFALRLKPLSMKSTVCLLFDVQIASTSISETWMNEVDLLLFLDLKHFILSKHVSKSSKKLHQRT